MASFTSAVSKLSLGGSWWTRAEPPVDSETKYIYSAFTKIPALSLRQSDLHVIAELADDPPVDNAVPMYCFKNVQTLELLDVDPRTLLGWDHLSETLRSLSIKRGGIEDVTDLLVDAVLDDQYRRQGSTPTSSSSSSSSPSTLARPRMSRFASVRFRQGAPITVPSPVEEEAEHESHKEDTEPPSPPKQLLPPQKWRLLRHLSLSDNALTFFPATPLASLTSLTHLDLSSNLLVSVPPGLSALYNLVSLNLADNMIDSVLGIYAILGQVLTINLSSNRLDSLCGLERLVALERIDLRNNRVEDPDEVGRLAVLPNIAEVFVAGNPMAIVDEQYRVRCFEHFAQEGKSVLLDGSGPSFLEARNMRTTLPPATPELDAAEARRRSSAPSPTVVAVGGASPLSPQPRRSQDQQRTSILINGGAPPATPPTHDPHAHLSSPSSVLSGGSKQAKKRKPKRMVDLDGSHSDASTAHPSDSSPLGLQPQRGSRHRRGASESETANKRGGGDLLPSVELHVGGDLKGAEPVIAVQRKSKAAKKKSRHGRYSTEGNPADVPDRLAAAANAVDDARPAPVLEVGEDGEEETSAADAYRARIDALRNEVGDNWLKVLTQSGGLPTGVTNNPP